MLAVVCAFCPSQCWNLYLSWPIEQVQGFCWRRPLKVDRKFCKMMEDLQSCKCFNETRSQMSHSVNEKWWRRFGNTSVHYLMSATSSLSCTEFNHRQIGRSFNLKRQGHFEYSIDLCLKFHICIIVLFSPSQYKDEWSNIVTRSLVRLQECSPNEGLGGGYLSQ